MLRRTLSLSSLLLCACSSGPDRPFADDYEAPAVLLHAQFTDPPAGEVDRAFLSPYWIDTRNMTIDALLFGGDDSVPFGATGVQFLLRAGKDVPQPGGFGHDVRFFMMSARLSLPSGSLYPGAWEQPGLLLVYAPQATTWSPFGPAGSTVTFPQGYSLLERTCGPVPGQIQMQVGSSDETIQLRHVDGSTHDTSDLEQSEQDFAANCGATAPAVAMGARVFFDRARELAWTPDGAGIYYLSVADAADKTRSVALRQVRLADSYASEWAIVPNGGGLQIDKTGALFLHDEAHLLAVVPGTPPTLATTSLPATALLSPDGRWIAYWDVSESTSIHIWDVAAGADLTVLTGIFEGWSPDAQLAYWSDLPAPYPASEAAPPLSLSIFSPAVPGGNPSTYVVERSAGSARPVVWTSTGPQLAKVPEDWTSDGSICIGCFGLTLVDPATGAERQVLDTSVEVGLVYTSPMTNVMFVWRKKCGGLFDTVCSSSLLKINLLDATVQAVAESPEIVPIAISADGRKVAFGARDGIYVKDLP
jgi:hypothetical protein